MAFINNLTGVLRSRDFLLVLEAFKSLLAAERCIYIVACDPRLIQKALKNRGKQQTGSQ